MGILDAHSEDLIQAGRNSRIQPRGMAPAEPGMFHNFGSSAGNFFMRGMAEAGRSLSMAAAAVPVALDKVVGGDMSGQSLADQYFAFHDETFGKAVEHWTPKPSEVGAAGQIVGSLGAGILQFLANPSLAVANAQLSTSEDLVRQGVDAGPALVAGDIAGLGTVAGIALPIAGKTLAQRIATGVAGNLGQGIAQAGSTQAVLKAADAAPGIVAQFDPFDARNRTVDALMGIAFGAKAHMDSRLSQTQRDAIALVNQARHIEQASTPGRAAGDIELTQAVENTKTAMDQMLRGEPVAVADVAPRYITPAERAANLAAFMDGSKVVDAEGKPLMMYHGTRSEFDAFKAGDNWFSSSAPDANLYGGLNSDGAAVLPVYLRMRNPRVIEGQGKTTRQIQDAVSLLRGDEDGLLVMDQGRIQWAITADSPEQIKSATGNSGLFNPNSASLTDPVVAQHQEASLRDTEAAQRMAQTLADAVDSAKAGPEGLLREAARLRASADSATTREIGDRSRLAARMLESAAVSRETSRIVNESIPPADQIKRPDMRAESTGQMKPTDQAGPIFPDDLIIPHPDTEAPMRANDLIQEARAEAERVKTTADGFMMTAANCLLGAI